MGWDWQTFFVRIGIPTSVSSRYAEIFRQNRVSKDMLPELDKATLADLGVVAIGDQLAIIRNARDLAFDIEADCPTKLRVRIDGPGTGKSEEVANGSSSTSGEHRQRQPAPDRLEIYHVKMPEGNTARTRVIMRNAGMMRKHGLAVRGTTGIRQGGRSVSPVDKKSDAVIRMRQERERLTTRTDDPVITRLGVRGLYSDEGLRPLGGRIQKRSVQGAVLGSSRSRATDEDVAVRVQIPPRNERLRRIAGQPRSRLTASMSKRISRSNGNGLPRVTVKLRGPDVGEGTSLRTARSIRKPVHTRLSTTSGNIGRAHRAVTRRPIQQTYLAEDDLSADEEYVDDEMVWEEEEVDDEFEDDYEVDEFIEDRPSVYNRLSRVRML